MWLLFVLLHCTVFLVFVTLRIIYSISFYAWKADFCTLSSVIDCLCKQLFENVLHCLSCLIQSPPCREILALCDRLLPRQLDFTHSLFALRVSCILFYFFTSRKLVSQSAHTHVTFFFLVIDFPILFPAAVSRVSTNRSRWMKWPRMNCGKDSNAVIGTLTLTTCPSVCVCLPNLSLGSALAFT